MFVIKPPIPMIRSACSLGLVVTSLLVGTFHASGQALGDRIQSQSLIFAAPQPPTDQGAPTGRRQGGASRGPCRTYESLTALTPITQGKVWGLTTHDRPTFWFYVPHSLATNVPIEFALQDEDDNYVYHTTFNAPELQSGVVSITIPATAQSLNVDQTYRWTFSIYCDAARPSASVFVTGSVQRVTPTLELQRQLRTALPLEQASLYAANGIWYEALTILATLKLANPTDAHANRAWLELLEQADLEAIATSPVVSCCTFSPMTRTH